MALPADIGRTARAAAALAVLAIAIGPLSTEALVQELFTTNAICSQRYCVNPVFPGLDVLPSLEAGRWQKLNLTGISQLMSFCGKVVDYDPALPISETGNSTLAGGGDPQARAQRVRELQAAGLPTLDYQLSGPVSAVEDAVAVADRAAARRYFAHLSGMGVEAWEHVAPMEESAHPMRACARSVARLACFTFFPKAPVSTQHGQEVAYVRPCRTPCDSYLEACGVECCDESLSCVWGGNSAHGALQAGPRRTQGVGGQEILLQTGYVDAAAPSPLCTG